MQILVTYGSKRGGTAGIAGMLARAIEERGIDVVLADADGKRDPREFDAIIVGGALYSNRWHKAARKYVKHYERALSAKPVWVFSSGPLDDSAVEHAIPPVRHVQQAMELSGAIGHVTFGGRLEPDAKGFPASAMAKNKSGDWRDRTHINAWANQVADVLEGKPTEVIAGS
jgi:menaquinone-dependent protoporphyrinogen oxidase